MVFAVLVERFLHWPVAYHPLAFFRLIAKNLALRVNPSKPRSAQQRKIAGALAATLLLLPFIMIVAMLLYLAPYPFIFDFLLLLVALQYRPALRAYDKIRVNLQADKKALARHYLDSMVLRDTANLSPMGIAKAAIESLIYRTQAHQVGVLFWFLIGGGTAALAVRLLAELNHSWNTKLARFVFFGRPVKLLWQIINWIPQLLFLIAFALAQNISGAFAGLRAKRTFPGVSTLKLVTASALGIQLNGPAFYDGQKNRAPRVGGPREVRFDDLQRCRNTLYRSMAILWVTLLLTTIVSVHIQ